MGILRYVVQGFGWEVGRTAARESIDALAEGSDEDGEETAAPAPTKRDLAKLEKERRKEEARRTADIEAQLRALKKANR